MPQIKEDAQETSMLITSQHTDKNPNLNEKRKELIWDAVESDDLDRILGLKVSLNDIEHLRFDYDMNFLQLVCNEEST